MSIPTFSLRRWLSQPDPIESFFPKKMDQQFRSIIQPMLQKLPMGAMSRIAMDYQKNLLDLIVFAPYSCKDKVFLGTTACSEFMQDFANQPVALLQFKSPLSVSDQTKEKMKDAFQKACEELDIKGFFMPFHTDAEPNLCNQTLNWDETAAFVPV